MKRWLVGELSMTRLIQSIAFIYGCVAVFVFFYAVYHDLFLGDRQRCSSAIVEF
jgi:hypothetical protein